MDQSTRTMPANGWAGSIELVAPVRVIVLAGGGAVVGSLLQTAAIHPAVASLALSLEREAFGGMFDLLSQLPGRGIVKLVEARATLFDSVLAAADGWDGPLLVTSADHGLLSSRSIDALVAALETADVAVAFAPRETASAQNPQERASRPPFRRQRLCERRSLCRDGTAGSVSRRSFSRRVQVCRQSLANLARVWLGQPPPACLGAVTLPEAMERVSRRLGLRIVPLVLQDGSAIGGDHAAPAPMPAPSAWRPGLG